MGYFAADAGKNAPDTTHITLKKAYTGNTTLCGLRMNKSWAVTTPYGGGDGPLCKKCKISAKKLKLSKDLWGW